MFWKKGLFGSFPNQVACISKPTRSLSVLHTWNAAGDREIERRHDFLTSSKTDLLSHWTFENYPKLSSVGHFQSEQAFTPPTHFRTLFGFLEKFGNCRPPLTELQVDFCHYLILFNCYLECDLGVLHIIVSMLHSVKPVVTYRWLKDQVRNIGCLSLSVGLTLCNDKWFTIRRDTSVFSSEIHSRTQDKRETRELSALQVHVTRSTQVMALALPSNLKWRPISSHSISSNFIFCTSLYFEELSQWKFHKAGRLVED